MNPVIDQMLGLTADIAEELLLIKDAGRGDLPDGLKLKIISLAELAATTGDSSATDFGEDSAGEGVIRSEETPEKEIEEAGHEETFEMADEETPEEIPEEVPEEKSHDIVAPADEVPADKVPVDEVQVDEEISDEDSGHSVVEMPSCQPEETEKTSCQPEEKIAGPSDFTEEEDLLEVASAEFEETADAIPGDSSDPALEEVAESAEYEEEADADAGGDMDADKEIHHQTEDILEPLEMEIDTDPEPETDLADSPVCHVNPADLQRSFSINDAFLFRREIFGGSKPDFLKALDHIATLPDRRSLQGYLVEELNLNLNESPGKEFYQTLAVFFK